MSNHYQKGLSLVDTLMSVVILFFLTSTILPLTYNMNQKIIVQQKKVHAAEVAFNGALKNKRYGEVAGQQQINETNYEWRFEHEQICVVYSYRGVENELCVQ